MDGEEVEQSVFGPAPVRMKLDKPVANRFILSAIRHAQGNAPPRPPSPLAQLFAPPASTQQGAVRKAGSV